MSRDRKSDGYYGKGKRKDAELVTLPKQIEAVERDLRMKSALYPRWVAGGRMRQEDANRDICEMAAVLETLEVYRMRQMS